MLKAVNRHLRIWMNRRVFFKEIAVPLAMDFPGPTSCCDNFNNYSRKRQLCFQLDLSVILVMEILQR